MERFRIFVVDSLVAGSLVVIPIYLAILVLLKVAESLAGLVRPVAALLPDWFPAETATSVLLVLIACFLVGVALRTPKGQALRTEIEDSICQKLRNRPVNTVWRVVFGLTHS